MPPRITPMRPTVPNGQPMTSSILDRIRPIEQANYNRLKCSFYGDSGTGKTRLACTFPKPILLIATEVGTDSVVGTLGVDVAPSQCAADYWALLDHVKDGKSSWSFDGKLWKHHTDKEDNPSFVGDKYKTVVLDTASKLRRDRITELFALQGKEVPRSQPFLYAGKEWKDVWQQCSYDMSKMLSAILDIPRIHECCIVVNSHEANLTYNSEDSDKSSEMLKPNISSAIGKAVADFLNAEVSYMGQLLIRDKFEMGVEKMGDIESPVKVKTGTEYVMRVGPDAVYRTKFRRPLTVTKPLPDFITNVTYEGIIKVIKGEY